MHVAYFSNLAPNELSAAAPVGLDRAFEGPPQAARRSPISAKVASSPACRRYRHFTVGADVVARSALMVFMAVPFISWPRRGAAISLHARGLPPVREAAGAYASLCPKRNPPTRRAAALHAARTPSPPHGLIGSERRLVVAWIANPAVIGPSCSRWRCQIGLFTVWARRGKR